jgi:YfiH family protein
MPFYQPEIIRYFRFESLETPGVEHAIFTRRGGISPKPWASLNVGGLRGDDPGRVLQNRLISFQALGRDPDSVYDVWQVHGTEVVCTQSPRPAGTMHIKADGILTNQPGITLFMRFGDCVPVFFFDPHRRVVGLAHAGWKGTVDGMVTQMVTAMQAEYGSNPAEILTAIGPSIAAHHYPVGAEVVAEVEKAFRDEAVGLLDRSNGQAHLDLWAANQLLLEKARVKQVEIAGICTACHLEDWYSHRGEQGQTGRFGALIALKEA